MVFFTQALHAVQFRKYVGDKSAKKGCSKAFRQMCDGKDGNFPSCCVGSKLESNPKMFFVCAVCVLNICRWTNCLVMNFFKDVKEVELAADALPNDDTVVETIAFLQIVFENALLIEYVHVLFGGTIPIRLCQGKG